MFNLFKKQSNEILWWTEEIFFPPSNPGNPLSAGHGFKVRYSPKRTSLLLTANGACFIDDIKEILTIRQCHPAIHRFALLGVPVAFAAVGLNKTRSRLAPDQAVLHAGRGYSRFAGEFQEISNVIANSHANLIKLYQRLVAESELIEIPAGSCGSEIAAAQARVAELEGVLDTFRETKPCN